MGYSYMLRGEFERARRIFLEAYEKDPGNAVIRNNLARLDSGTAHTGRNLRKAAYVGTNRPQYEARSETPPAATASAETSSGSGDNELAGAPATSSGAWSIQVGSFPTEREADRHLKRTSDLGLASLRGKSAGTSRFVKGNKSYYRARFGGFSKQGAQTACSDLASRSIPCYPVLGSAG
jgi:hypothetical protein